jgi:hypothetical protein
VLERAVAFVEDVGLLLLEAPFISPSQNITDIHMSVSATVGFSLKQCERWDWCPTKRYISERSSKSLDRWVSFVNQEHQNFYDHRTHLFIKNLKWPSLKGHGFNVFYYFGPDGSRSCYSSFGIATWNRVPPRNSSSIVRRIELRYYSTVSTSALGMSQPPVQGTFSVEEKATGA